MTVMGSRVALFKRMTSQFDEEDDSLLVLSCHRLTVLPWGACVRDCWGLHSTDTASLLRLSSPTDFIWCESPQQCEVH